MKGGDLIWVRAQVVQTTPNALLLSFTGPGGAPVTYAVSPDIATVPAHLPKPEPEEPTEAL